MATVDGLALIAQNLDIFAVEIMAAVSADLDWLAALGTLFGLVFGLPGVIIGPFVGAVLGELTANRNLVRAGRAGVAAWIGFALGIAAKVGLVFVMLGIFLVAFLF